MSNNRILPPNRSFDGTNNNGEHPRWGSVGERFMRQTSFGYEDGVSVASGLRRPNARTISNQICKQTRSVPDPRGLSDLVGLWSLFLSHMVNAFRGAEPREDFNISVPDGDPVFEPGSFIPVFRWVYDISTGTSTTNPRLQVNNIGSYLDASTVYGADVSRASVLRTFNKGILKTSDGNLLPLNTYNLPNRVPGDRYFLAGDELANTSFGLLALNTLFVREHNRLATGFAASNPALSDEELYQKARKFVAAQIQAITYNEYLPALLGPDRVRSSEAYDPSVNATISEIFSVVGFRFGHSMLPPYFVLLYDDGEVRQVPQRVSFFNPDIIKRDGIDPIFRGFAAHVQEKVDQRVVDDIRNQTIRFNVKIDLVAYDIQSARDFGIAGYNQVRADLGLNPVSGFSDITSDPTLQRALADVYGGVNDIDPLIGGLAEDAVSGSALGPLFTTIVAEQFERLRKGDRFWFENDPAFSSDAVRDLKKTTLGDLITRNTGVIDLQDNVFFAGHPSRYTLKRVTLPAHPV
jgi:peroxidase